MPGSFRLPFLALFCSCIAPLSAQETQLPHTWKISFSDSSQFSNPAYDDRHWATVEVPANWESQGHPTYDGYAWYRVTFECPAALTKTPVVLFAGTIDDADETWLNGQRIGASGQFPPNDQTAWDLQRKYMIPKGLLKTHNQLAIRVYDGAGGGGIYGGRLSIVSAAQVERERQDQLRRKKSYPYLTTSNGLIAAVYDERSDRIEAAWPHIFSFVDSGITVEPYVRNIQAAGKMGKPQQVRYIANTHVIEVKYAACKVYWLASFTMGQKILYAIVRGQPGVVAGMTFHWEAGAGMIDTVYTPRAGEKHFLFSFEDPEGQNRRQMQEYGNNSRRSSVALPEAETAWMKQVFQRCHFPEGLTPKERALFEQSVAILKMAQVGDGEVFPRAPGQILASLRPGVWAIAWVRDGAFALMAMNALGLFEEARKGLLFMLQAAPSNQYKHYVHTDGKDYGIGVDYQISVTRYFGNGREESDYAGDRGPNIEIDDFGFFLMAFSDYVEKSGDMAFFREWAPFVQAKVCDPIIHNIDRDDVIRADSGPWEHHLPGQRYTMTTSVCAKGLYAFARLQKSANLTSEKNEAAAARLMQGLQHNMVYKHELLAGTAEDRHPDDHYFYDASTLEVWASGLLTDTTLFRAQMRAYDTNMRANGPKRGYIRVKSNDSYENQEWPFAGLRAAVAQTRFGNDAEAAMLIHWITEIAAANHNQIPEILSNETAEYKGAIPMVGYGAGAYVLSLYSRRKPVLKH